MVYRDVIGLDNFGVNALGSIIVSDDRPELPGGCAALTILVVRLEYHVNIYACESAVSWLVDLDIQIEEPRGVLPKDTPSRIGQEGAVDLDSSHLSVSQTLSVLFQQRPSLLSVVVNATLQPVPAPRGYRWD